MPATSSRGTSVRLMTASRNVRSFMALLRIGKASRHAKPKKSTCRSGEGRLHSDQHEGLWPVLPDRDGVRDLRRALDAPDPERAASRGAAVQRDPAGHAPDLADTARSAAA